MQHLPIAAKPGLYSLQEQPYNEAHHLSMVSWADSSAIILVMGARQYPTEVRSPILICHYNETESTMSLHVSIFVLEGIALQ